MTSTATATDAESPERAETATDEVATDSETATDEAAKQEVESGEIAGLEKLRGCPRFSSLWQQSQMAFFPHVS
jgi:hypothetical protein